MLEMVPRVRQPFICLFLLYFVEFMVSSTYKYTFNVNRCTRLSYETLPLYWKHVQRRKRKVIDSVDHFSEVVYNAHLSINRIYGFCKFKLQILLSVFVFVLSLVH